MTIRLAGDWAPRTIQVMPLAWDGLAIINLEGPILDNPTDDEKSPKAGPCLWHATLPRGIEKAAYVLANNHIMDYGGRGLTQTIDIIKSSNAYHCGAAANLDASRKPLILNHDGVCVGIISRCETQFGIAERDRPGASPIDSTINQDIKELKSNCDLLIVSLHAAAEMSPWPSPSRQDLCRALIDAGADIVHGHHSHVPQGWEKYGDGYIFYGLGNLCVDPSSWSENPNCLWSLTPQVFHSENNLSVDIKTTEIKSNQSGLLQVIDSLDESKEAQNRYLQICNQPLGDRRLLEGLWQEIAVDLYQSHFGPWLGLNQAQAHDPKGLFSSLKLKASKVKNLIRKSGAKRNPIQLTPPSRYTQMLWYHLFACESHSSAISTALGVLSGSIGDLRSEQTAQLVSEMMNGPH
jgi:hypothetical protein